MTSARVPPVVGLSGVVGAGKSTVAAFLRELGCRVIDVDALGHEALASPPVRDLVIGEFGAAVADAHGGIDRRALARRVFGDRDALGRLERIVHPAVLARLDDLLSCARCSGARAVVVDCALLFESGIDRRCDTTVVVEADDAVRIRRISESRGWQAADIAGRQAAQFAAEEKRSRAKHALRNDGTEAELRAATRALLDELAPVDRSRAEPASGRS